MRAASYVIPRAAGDSEDGECIVYYFGPGQGGGVEANVKRWIGQFRTPDGKPADDLAERTEWTANGVKLTQVDVSGTYLFKPAPMMPKAVEKPGFRMLAVIAEAPQAPVFFKLTGPKKTVDGAQKAFRVMLDSVKK